MGVNYIDGDYFVGSSGKPITNQGYYVWETNGLLPETIYTFDAYGCVIA